MANHQKQRYLSNNTNHNGAGIHNTYPQRLTQNYKFQYQSNDLHFRLHVSDDKFVAGLWIVNRKMSAKSIFFFNFKFMIHVMIHVFNLILDVCIVAFAECSLSSQDICV